MLRAGMRERQMLKHLLRTCSLVMLIALATMSPSVGSADEKSASQIQEEVWSLSLPLPILARLVRPVGTGPFPLVIMNYGVSFDQQVGRFYPPVELRDAAHWFALPRAYVSRRCCYDDHPDFGWGHRLLPLNALTGHRCINLATGREGGAVPKTIAVLGSALFFAVAPSSVAGLVPWWITRWEFRPPFFDLDATRAIGILLIVAGLPGLVDSFARFALQGLGTPAPIAPAQNLVVTGLSLR